MSAQRNEQQAKYKHSSKYQRHTSQSKTKQIKHLIYSFTPTYFPQTWRRVAQKANQNTLKNILVQGLRKMAYRLDVSWDSIQARFDCESSILKRSNSHDKRITYLVKPRNKISWHLTYLNRSSDDSLRLSVVSQLMYEYAKSVQKNFKSTKFSLLKTGFSY